VTYGDLTNRDVACIDQLKSAYRRTWTSGAVLLNSDTKCDGVNYVTENYGLYDPEECSVWCYEMHGLFMS
jgi:hypothetical protein